MNGTLLARRCALLGAFLVFGFQAGPAGSQTPNPNFVECAISPAGDLTCTSTAGGSCAVISRYSNVCTGAGAIATCSKDNRGRAGCAPQNGGPAVCYVENGTAKCYARSISALLQFPPTSLVFGNVVIDTSKVSSQFLAPKNLNPPDGYTILGFHVTGEFTITAQSGTCSGYTTYPGSCALHVTARPRLAGTRVGTLTMVTDRGSHHMPLSVVGMGFAAPTASDKNAGIAAGLRPVGAASRQLRKLLAVPKSATGGLSCDAESGRDRLPPGGAKLPRPGSGMPSGDLDEPSPSYSVSVGEFNRLEPPDPFDFFELPPPSGGGGSPFHPIPEGVLPTGFAGAVTSLPASGSASAGTAGNLGAGSAAQVQTDYAGTFANPLSFVRTYNSAGFSSTTSVRQHVGIGWRTNWDHSVALGANGVSATLHRGDGASYAYDYDAANGNWTTSGDVTGTLVWVKDANGYPYGWTYTHPTGLTERYDAIGRLVSVERIQGERYTLSYNGRGLLHNVDNNLFRYLTFGYDGEGRLASMTNPAGMVTGYSYDSQSRLTQVDYPDLTTRRFRYENAAFPFALTAVVDATGNAYATFNYDAQGRITGRQLAGGVGAESMSYPSNLRATFTDAHGATWSKNFVTVNGRVLLGSETVACTGCPSAAEQSTYASFGSVTSVTNRNGIKTTTAHNSRKLPATIVEAADRPEARTTFITWHPTLDLPITTSAGVNTVNQQYDAQGRMTSTTVTGGGFTRTTSYAYNSRGQVTRIDGPRTDAADVTTFEYDGVGNLLVETNALGQRTVYAEYNGHGQPRRITYPNATIKTISYDIRGRVSSENLGGVTTSYTYDPNGNLATTTTNDGSVITNLYDAAHRLVGIDNSKGERIRHTLNNAGLIIRTDSFDNVGTLVSTIRSAYDGLGRRTQQIDADGRVIHYSYDGTGNLTAITDPRNKTTVTHYDAFNRPVLVVDPLGGHTRFGYDLANRLTTFVDSRGNGTSYTFNAVGDNTRLASPDTGTTTYTFDRAGNTLTRLDARGQRAIFAYDAAGRLIRVTYDDGSPGVTRTYDVAPNGVGQLASVVDPAGTTSYTYDAHGRLVTKTQQVQGVTVQVSYTRDALGRVTKVRYPSGNVLQTSYLNAGRPSALVWNGTTVLSGVQYFPFGAAESWLFGGSYEYTRYVDLNGRVSGYRTPTGVRNLTYDAAGRIIRSAEGTRIQDFTYDDLGRLRSFSGHTTAAAAESRFYDYDANGNRLSSLVNSNTAYYSYAADSNRLKSVSGLYTNSYDAAGNLISDGRLLHSYDARGRLMQTIVSNPGGTTLTYHYNDRNQRVALGDSAGNSGKVWLYDEDGRMLGEYTTSGGVRVQELIWLGSIPVAVTGNTPADCGRASCSPNDLGYIWTDHLNTPRAITVAGTTIWAWESAPFGDTVPNGISWRGTMVFNHRFPGQYFDRATGLHQNVNRDYDPNLGRYIQSDPVGLKGGTNTYTYAINAPTHAIDPRGLDTYRCVRPMKPFVGVNWKPGPYYHEYVCVYDDLRGGTICGSITATGYVVNSPARRTTPSDGDVYEPTRCERVLAPNACIESCILDMLAGALPVYDVLASVRQRRPGTGNCQTFTRDAIQGCVQRCAKGP